MSGMVKGIKAWTNDKSAECKTLKIKIWVCENINEPCKQKHFYSMIQNSHIN